MFGHFFCNVHGAQDDAIKHVEHPHQTRMQILSPGANNSTSRDKLAPKIFSATMEIDALAAHMHESECDSWITECVGEWQNSKETAQVSQCENVATWLIHFTYHQLV